jgi:hypothetical protein
MSYRLIPFHSQPHEGIDFNKELVVASFDPGLTNFATRIERRAPGKAPVKLYYEKVNFGGSASTKATQEDGENVIDIWGLVIDYLESILVFLALVNLFAFEKQMSPNHSVSRMSQHVMTYMMTKFRDVPPYAVMIEIDPRLKTIILEPLLPPELQKGRCRREAKKQRERALKKASVALARQFFARDGDTESLALLDANKKKQDDLADVKVQIEALDKYLTEEEARLPPSK